MITVVEKLARPFEVVPGVLLDAVWWRRAIGGEELGSSDGQLSWID